jgi:hypothetical protein
MAIMGLSKDRDILVSPSRRPKNKAEAEFFDQAEKNGLIITKRGFPDFACFLPDGRFILVEVKKLRSRKLKYWQRRVMQELTKLGVPCFKWSPDMGFVKIVSPVKKP